jgi:hypothetical protein
MSWHCCRRLQGSSVVNKNAGGARNLEHENLVGEQAGMFHRTDDEEGRLNKMFHKDINRLPVERQL